MHDLYEEIEKRRASYEQEIRKCQGTIEVNRGMIDGFRKLLAELPRKPIKRPKKASVEAMLADLQADLQPEGAQGHGVLTGVGTLTLTDADGNDVTAENTVAADKD